MKLVKVNGLKKQETENDCVSFHKFVILEISSENISISYLLPHTVS